MSSDKAGGISRRTALKYSATGVAAGTIGAGGGYAFATSKLDAPLQPVATDLLPRIERGERFRLRDLGIIIGSLPTGPNNAITDVPGVKVGYKTIIRDDPGIARTGVTVIIPREEPIQKNWCYAGFYRHNGCGEVTGTQWIEEAGVLSSPIAITNTSQVGIVHQTLCKIGYERYGDLDFLLPVVAETYDGGFNDLSGFWITEKDVREAYDDAHGGPIAEGNVGGGTGMHFFDFKGGSGTSSRIVDFKGQKYTVGVFVQSNYGTDQRQYYRVNGAPVGKEISYDEVPKAGPAAKHSCIAVIATDAPFLPGQCKRLATRAGIGIADTGSVADNGSGDMYLAFSTANDVAPESDDNVMRTAESIPDWEITPFFHAVSEAFQEAAHNSATMAQTLQGADRTLYAIPLDRLVEIVKKHGLYGPGFHG
jgi:D-aminopeptidase